jgi:hypothetical protein
VNVVDYVQTTEGEAEAGRRGGTTGEVYKLKYNPHHTPEPKVPDKATGQA